MSGVINDAPLDQQPSRVCGITPDSRNAPRLLGVYAPWRLQAYGYSLAVLYLLALLLFYIWGLWPVDRAGSPILMDFIQFWIAGTQTLKGDAAELYDSAQFAKLQIAALGPREAGSFLYPSFPYPPVSLLFMAPFGLLRYLPAFLTFEIVTLLGFVAIVLLIVRRPPAIALTLAAPSTPINILHGQTGFLRASLVGAALLVLERRPLIAGVFIGCLAYKPQFAILFPVALIAAKQWRAFAAAAITTAGLVAVSILAIGIGTWEAFPRELLHATELLRLEALDYTGWTYHQNIYGDIRYLHGSRELAWLAHGCVAVATAAIVWLVWRSSARYPLKTAALAAATLIPRLGVG